MSIWIFNTCVVFVLCVVFAGIIIPKILLIAFRKRLFDVPDERKIHTSIVPRLGGIAFKPVVFFSVALLLGVNIVAGHLEILEAFEKDVRALAFGFCTIMVLYLVGMADDLIGIRYRAKFVIQILCGIMLIAGGVWIENLHGVLGIYTLPVWVAYPFTVLVVVFVINAINLIDGIDGLASGLCSVALIIYGLAFFSLHMYVYAMLSFATLGVLVPFFYYNVFGNAERGRKIFMGDTGSLTIGMMLCFLGIILSQSYQYEGTDLPNSIVLAFAPMLVPCFDVVRVFLHRIRNGKNPFMPDKSHIHHKLLALGMKQHWAMITILFVSLVFSLCNIVLSVYVNVNILLGLDLLIWIVTNVWLTKQIKRHNSMKNATVKSA